LPVVIRNHQEQFGPRPLRVARANKSSDRRLESQDRKIITGDELTVDPLGLAFFSDVEGRHQSGHDFLEGRELGLQIAIFQPRGAGIAAGFGVRLDQQKVRCVTDGRHRLEEHQLNPREDRGIHTDSDSQRNDDDGCEARHAANAARGISQIAEQILNPWKRSLGAIVLLHGLDAAELEHGLAPGLDGREASAKIFFGLQSDMFVNLLPQAIVLFARGGQVGDAVEESPQRLHDRSSVFAAKNRSMIAAVCSQP
jgi:hypothetical protein